MQRQQHSNLVAALAALLLIITACTVKNDNKQAAELLQQADAHASIGEYTAAEAAYRRALQRQPASVAPALQLAKLYEAWNRPQAGIEALEEAQRRGLSEEAARPLRLKLLARADAWDQIIVEAQEYSQTTGDASVLAIFTQAWLHQRKCDEALGTAISWHDTSPSDADAVKIWGSLTGNFVELCEVAPHLCVTQQNCAGSCDLHLGYLLLRAEEWPLAVCVLERALAAAPASAEGHAWLGEALARTTPDPAAQATARDHFEQAVHLAPDTPLGWLLLGTHDLRRGAYESAREALLQAQSLAPDNPAPCLAIAELKAQTGHYEEISTWTQAALERAPEDAEIWKAVARFYLARNLIQEDQPVQAAQGAVRLAPNDAEAHRLLGWAYMLNNDTARALSALDEALRLNPQLGEAHYLRGLALRITGENEAAQEAFVKATDLGYRP